MLQARLDIKPTSSTFQQTDALGGTTLFGYERQRQTCAEGRGGHAQYSSMRSTGACTITGAANTASAFGTLGGSYANHYVYDGIDRLTDATQSYGTGSTLAASYSASGRLCGRSQTSNGQDAVFGYDNGDRPHAPRRIINSNYHTQNDLLWDADGNLAQNNTHSLTDGSFQRSRHLFWTEDSRLSGVVDMQYFSYYAYGHDGERVLRMIGSNNMVDVNAVSIRYSAVVDKVILYPSPYLVADHHGYTKHYYAGTERVCARIGNGGLNHGGGFIGNSTEIEVSARNLFDSTLSQMQKRTLPPNNPNAIASACGGVPMSMPLEPVPTKIQAKAIVSIDDFNSSMVQYSGTTQQNEEAYFYHGDHLGSASWITDADGIPVQHLQYLPFGEPFVNQRTTGYSERFTFTGKERDSETGYSYFGARYYDSDLSGLFLSVDPMSDKYPSISPYAYCAWNPLKLVDPDGNEIDDYRLNTKNGSLIKIRITSDKNDAIFVDNNSNASFYTDKGMLNGKIGEDISKKGFDASNGKQKQGVELMYFISTNVHVELSGWGYKDQRGKDGIYIEPWNNNTGNSCKVSGFVGNTTTQRRHRQFHLHIHPGLQNGNGGQGRPSKKDYKRAEKYGGTFFIISKQDGLTRFSSDGGNNKYWYPSKNKAPSSLRQFIKN